jgi:hypothetical protein
MKLRWSNGVSAAVEFICDRAEDTARAMANGATDYRARAQAADRQDAEHNWIAFHRTQTGRVGAHAGDGRGWDSHRSFASLAEAVAGTRVPCGWTLRPEISEVRPPLYHRPFAGQSDELLYLHIEADAGMWAEPVFPPATGDVPIRLPATTLNGQPCPDGRAEFRLARRTHVLLAADKRVVLTAGPDHQVVHTGCHDEPEPTLCGLYRNDWVLVVGPDHWHGPAVFAACAAAVGGQHAFTAFVGDVADAVVKPTDPRQ